MLTQKCLSFFFFWLIISLFLLFLLLIYFYKSLSRDGRLSLHESAYFCNVEIIKALFDVENNEDQDALKSYANTRRFLFLNFFLLFS